MIHLGDLELMAVVELEAGAGIQPSMIRCSGGGEKEVWAGLVGLVGEHRLEQDMTQWVQAMECLEVGWGDSRVVDMVDLVVEGWEGVLVGILSEWEREEVCMVWLEQKTMGDKYSRLWPYEHMYA